MARGSVTWNLGTLAPGARRTIRGSVLISGGTPGLKRNVALAAAANARVADDHADTRLIGQGVLGVQVPPAVTG